MRCAPIPMRRATSRRCWRRGPRPFPIARSFRRFAACWTSELGGLNKFVHTWVYKDLNDRARIREESRKPGRSWPPQAGVRPIRQENKLLIPAAFSPGKVVLNRSIPVRRLQQAAAVDRDDRAVDEGHRCRQPEDHRRHLLGLGDPLERVAGDPLRALLRGSTSWSSAFPSACRDGGPPDSRRQGPR